LIRPAAYPAHESLRARCAELLARLEPFPDVRERVERFHREQFRPEMIGVHLRRGDCCVSDPCAAPLPGYLRFERVTMATGLYYLVKAVGRLRYGRGIPFAKLWMWLIADGSRDVISSPGPPVTTGDTEHRRRLTADGSA
jgi:hypothetical protein